MSQITSVSSVWKHLSSASLSFVRGMHRWPVVSPPKGPVTRKMFPFDDIIIFIRINQMSFSWKQYMPSLFCMCVENIHPSISLLMPASNIEIVLAMQRVRSSAAKVEIILPEYSCFSTRKDKKYYRHGGQILAKLLSPLPGPATFIDNKYRRDIQKAVITLMSLYFIHNFVHNTSISRVWGK